MDMTRGKKAIFDGTGRDGFNQSMAFRDIPSDVRISAEQKIDFNDGKFCDIFFLFFWFRQTKSKEESDKSVSGINLKWTQIREQEQL